MGKYDKLLTKVLDGSSDANIDFSKLCRLLQCLGFSERVRDSHHIFRKKDIDQLINLQKDGSKAKVYQVKQVRKIIRDYNLKIQK